jgi:hypothetical protein
LARSYVGAVPADLVLVCGVFGNISDGDIEATVAVLPSFCAPGATVIWTRHRRPPDLTPTILEWFVRAGFVAQSFAAPEGYVLGVGCHRLGAGAGAGAGAGVGAGAESGAAFDPSLRLFDFVGDGQLPA